MSTISFHNCINITVDEYFPFLSSFIQGTRFLHVSITLWSSLDAVIIVSLAEVIHHMWLRVWLMYFATVIAIIIAKYIVLLRLYGINNHSRLIKMFSSVHNISEFLLYRILGAVTFNSLTNWSFRRLSKQHSLKPRRKAWSSVATFSNGSFCSRTRFTNNPDAPIVDLLIENAYFWYNDTFPYLRSHSLFCVLL